MRRIALFLSVIACGAATPTALLAQESFASNVNYQVSDFFANSKKTGYKLSPDSKLLSFMKSTTSENGLSRMNIFIQPISNGTPENSEQQLTFESIGNISGYVWKDPQTIIYSQDNGGDENYHLYAINISDRSVKDLTPFENVSAHIEDILNDENDKILVSHNNRDKTTMDLYRINIKTGRCELVSSNPGNISSWILDYNGELRLTSNIDGLNSNVVYYKNGKKIGTIITSDYKTAVVPLFFKSDNHNFYALSNRNRDKSALVEIDPSKPDVEKVIYESKDVDIMAAVKSTNKHSLVMAVWHEDKQKIHFFDRDAEKVFSEIQSLIPTYEITSLETNRSEQSYVIQASSDRMPGRYYLYDSPTKTLTKLSDVNPILNEEDLATVKPISYASRDGLKIHGYLTLPPKHKNDKKLACIVNPHGGPELRDVWEYNPEVQFLAHNGFCVLQVNFRGSTGYGRQFWHAGFGQWGLGMQNDITDGVHWLIDNGIADPKRVGIYGASYGGYATLAGITFTPDLYAAAVDYVGISNLFTFLKSIPPYWKIFIERQHEMVGDPVRDKARLEATSPVLHADRIKTPLFIAQGARDPRVNKAESDQMVAALKKQGVTVEYMVKENEGHGFNSEENRIEFYNAMMKFFVTHLKPNQ